MPACAKPKAANRDHRSRLQRHVFACAGGLRFPQIHFVDFAMKRAPADAEFFGSGGDVAICGGKRLGNQSSLSFVQIEQTRLFTESLAN